MRSALFSKKNLTNSLGFKLKSNNNAGLTLTELLVSVSIVVILLIIAMFLFPKQLGRARDAQRKTDLERIKVSFEDYYNDNGCYPDPEVLNDCNGDSFQPYLNSIPCDPITDDPYLYVPFPSQCQGYRVYTGLEDTDDPVIEVLNCNGPEGCGWGSYYNYGVAVGGSVYDSSGDQDAYPAPGGSVTPSAGGASPTATPPIIYVYACDASGVCNQFEEGHPDLEGCPVTFEDVNCNNECGEPANRCP